MTIDPPFLPRLAALRPGLAVFPALIVEEAWLRAAHYLAGPRLRLATAVLDAGLPLSPSALPSGAAFAMIPGDAGHLEHIRSRYPGGREERHLDQNGHLLFVSYALQ